MAMIIAVANAKGGVGKTTTVAAVSSVLASAGARVLMVDLDIQANLTYSSMRLEDYTGPFLYDAVPARRGLPVVSLAQRLDLVPSGLEMTRVERAMYNMCRREYIVSDMLRPLESSYDFIFLDCPPTLTLVTMNALACADRVLVPLMADRLSYLGLREIISFMQEDVAQLRSEALPVDVFLTMHETVTRVSRAWESVVRREFADSLLESRIRRDTKVREAASSSVLFMEYAPQSAAMADYKALTEEYFRRISK